MRLIHASGFKASEREGFRIVVFFNIFNTIQTLLEALEVLDLELTDPISKVRFFWNDSGTLHTDHHMKTGLC